MIYWQNFLAIFTNFKHILCLEISWLFILAVIFCALVFVVFGYITAGKSGDLNLKFGLMARNEFDEYSVCQETTHVPFRPVEYYPEFRFGYTLDYADNRNFYSHYVLFLPGPPKFIGEGLYEVERNRNGIVLISHQSLHQGGVAAPLAFNVNDPLGRWKMEIYVNDELIRSISFSVVHVFRNSSPPHDVRPHKNM